MTEPSPVAGRNRPETDPLQGLVAPVVEALLHALSGVPGADRAAIERLLDTAGGTGWDLAIPVHRFAAAAKKAPNDFATELAASLPDTPGVARRFAVGAYVNFEADPAWLAERTLAIVTALGDRYGCAAPTGRTVCVEHTSANPNAPFHIGRVRNALLGDTLARIERAAGHTVTTQYYVDDIGRQSAMVTWIWSKPREAWPPEIAATLEGGAETEERADHWLGRPYPAVAAYVKSHPEAAAELGELGDRLERGEDLPAHRRFCEAILGGMLESLRRVHVTFDEFVWESSLIHDGSVDAVIGRLRSAPHFVREENGALAIDTKSYGLPKEDERAVFLRGNGTSLYPTRDVAYHLQKFGRFERVVDVLGQDHLLHARTLEALLAEIGESRRPEFLLYQYITLPGGGRMSTRKGTVVWLDTLLDEAIDRARAEVVRRHPELPAGEAEQIAVAVASGAIRYHIVRVAADKAVAFQWEDALSFEGRSGPFVQYAYARATSLLRKAEAEGVATSAAPKGTELSTPGERDLLRVLARFPSVVAAAARTAHVHSIAGYGHDLAEAFNRFYQSTPVLKSDSERASRLALVAASRQVLANTLEMLGLERLDRM
ncbi:MAG: arginine--tRNA ligase [Candidatus Lutacidiplasmatales archaeon]